VVAPLSALILAVLFGVPATQPPAPALVAAGRPAPDDASPRGRLWQLLTAGATDGTSRPTSPRYLALESPGLRGYALYVAWSLPGLASGDEALLEAVASTLGGDGGWLSARLVRTGKAERVNVWFERRDGSAWFGVEVAGSKRTSTKELELAILETLAVLEAHAPRTLDAPDGSARPPGAQAAEVDGQAGISPLVVGRAVRRLLAPTSRAVVELQPPDAPDYARASKVPPRHVVEKGDTLTRIARRNGLDLDALVRLNGIDPDAPIHPGDELRVSDKRARRPKLHVVKPGDTFAKVARRYGVSQERLLEVNRMTSRKVTVGQKLVLPP
jgi:LysM repeat protein